MTWLATIICAVIGALVVIGLGFTLADSDNVLEHNDNVSRETDKENKQ